MNKYIRFSLIISVLIIVIGAWKEVRAPHMPAQTITEAFIATHLVKNNGLIRSNMTTRQQEYLSESIGLWMYYLQQVNNEQVFRQQFDVFQRYFYTSHQVIPWIIEVENVSTVNALIDDFRIMMALHHAAQKFGDANYEHTATAIGKTIVQRQLINGVFVDFYDENSAYANDSVTLSYMMPEAFQYLRSVGILASEYYEKNRRILVDAPSHEMYFFPKSYHIPSHTYQFEEEVNMIDQYYVGFYRAQWHGDVSQLVDFTKRQLAEHGRIFGRYDAREGQTTVAYESPSAYALAILMMLTLDEDDVAKQLWSQLQTLRVDDSSSPYYGGYIDVLSKDTHMFDNVLPAIVERRGQDAGIFTE